MIYTIPKDQERLDGEALFSLQKTWGRTHYAQHQGMQALQLGWNPQEGRRDAQVQQAYKWKGWDEFFPDNPY